MVSFRFIQAFQAFWQFRETKLFFQCQNPEKPECQVEIQRLEEDAAQQKLEVEAARKDLSVYFFRDARCDSLQPQWLRVLMSGSGSGASFFAEPENHNRTATLEPWKLGTCCWIAKLGYFWALTGWQFQILQELQKERVRQQDLVLKKKEREYFFPMKGAFASGENGKQFMCLPFSGRTKRQDTAKSWKCLRRCGRARAICCGRNRILFVAATGTVKSSIKFVCWIVLGWVWTLLQTKKTTATFCGFVIDMAWEEKARICEEQRQVRVWAWPFEAGLRHAVAMW